MLKVLVRVVTEDIADSSGNPGASYKQKLQELFGRITSKVGFILKNVVRVAIYVSVWAIVGVFWRNAFLYEI